MFCFVQLNVFSFSIQSYVLFVPGDNTSTERFQTDRHVSLQCGDTEWPWSDCIIAIGGTRSVVIRCGVRWIAYRYNIDTVDAVCSQGNYEQIICLGLNI